MTYRVFDLAAGQRLTSPSIDAADPRTDLGLPPVPPTNLLINPGFENGLTGWSNSARGRHGRRQPAAVRGDRIISLAADRASHSPSRPSISSPPVTRRCNSIRSNLVVVYGGRVRTAAEANPDQSTIYRHVPGRLAARRSVRPRRRRPTCRGPMGVGRRAYCHSGRHTARQVPLRDRAADRPEQRRPSRRRFLVLSVRLGRAEPGLAQATRPTKRHGQSVAAHRPAFARPLRRLVNRDTPHAIRWETYDNATNPQVRIDLYQDTADGPALLQTISAGAADTGSFSLDPRQFRNQLRHLRPARASVARRQSEPYSTGRPGAVCRAGGGT